MVKSKRYISESGSKRVYNALTSLTKSGSAMGDISPDTVTATTVTATTVNGTTVAATTATATTASATTVEATNLNEKTALSGVTVNGAFVLDRWATADLATNYTVPETPVAGAIFFDTTLGAIVVHNGTAWKQVSVEV
jgi:hypothetical protein